jgi:hypothetical protein
LQARGAFTRKEDIQKARERFVCVAVDLPKEDDKTPRAELLRKLNAAAADRFRIHVVVNSILVATAGSDAIAATVSHGSSNNIFQDGWKAWMKLPEKDRKPGAFQVEELKSNPWPRLPANGLALRVYARVLERNSEGRLCCPKTRTIVVNKRDIVLAEPGRDHCWLKEAEWKSLLPSDPKKGDRFAMPAAIAGRIISYHLLDIMHGPNANWPASDSSKELTWTVEEAGAQVVCLRLRGSARGVVGPYDRNRKGFKGVDWTFSGYVDYDPIKKTVRRFDLVAVGDGGAVDSPAGSLLGIAFELAQGDVPGDLLFPFVMKYAGEEGYFQAK